MTLTEEELTEWFHNAQNGLAYAHGVDFTSEVSEYIAFQQGRVQMLISALRKERAAKELAVKALKETLPCVQVDRLDFEQLRLLDFKEFSVHSLDTASVIIQAALAEIAELDGREK